MKKLFFAALLCAVVVLALLPATATATATNATSVLIGGVSLSGGNLCYHNGESGAAETANNESSGANAVFEPGYGDGKSTLTLYGLSALNSDSAHGDFCCAIYADGNLEIVLGDATESEVSTGASANCAAVYVTGSLTISGTGTLTATGGTATGNSYGVYARDGITVSSGTLTATGGTVNGSSSNSCGVSTNGGITASGGTITGTGGTATGENSNSYGVSAQNGITANGGAITGTGGKTGATGSNYGVYSNSSIECSGGTIEGNGYVPTPPTPASPTSPATACMRMAASPSPQASAR